MGIVLVGPGDTRGQSMHEVFGSWRQILVRTAQHLGAVLGALPLKMSMVSPWWSRELSFFVLSPGLLLSGCTCWSLGPTVVSLPPMTCGWRRA